MNEEEELPGSAKKYMKSLDAALRALPADRRQEITSEIREHIRERSGSGAPIDDLLNSFGAPENYAAQFVEEHKLIAALNSKRTDTMVSLLLGAAKRSSYAAMAGTGIVLIWIVTIPLVFFGVAKVFFPTTVGLWDVGEGYELGFNSGGATQDALGWFLPIIGVLAALLAYFLTKALARHGIKKLISKQGAISD